VDECIQGKAKLSRGSYYPDDTLCLALYALVPDENVFASTEAAIGHRWCHVNLCCEKCKRACEGEDEGEGAGEGECEGVIASASRVE